MAWTVQLDCPVGIFGETIYVRARWDGHEELAFNWASIALEDAKEGDLVELTIENSPSEDAARAQAGEVLSALRFSLVAVHPICGLVNKVWIGLPARTLDAALERASVAAAPKVRVSVACGQGDTIAKFSYFEL